MSYEKQFWEQPYHNSSEEERLEKLNISLNNSYKKLSEMYKLALEVGEATQKAYNMIVMSGVTIPKSTCIQLDAMMKEAQRKSRIINDYNNSL